MLFLTLWINQKQEIETAPQKATSNEANKFGKTIDEYEVKMVDITGRTLTYNSVEGVITSSNNSNRLKNLNIFIYIFIWLFLLKRIIKFIKNKIKIKRILINFYNF